MGGWDGKRIFVGKVISDRDIKVLGLAALRSLWIEDLDVFLSVDNEDLFVHKVLVFGLVGGCLLDWKPGWGPRWKGAG